MIMTPDMLGIRCPKELEHMYAEGAVSPGDGEPVVTSYPAYPMSAFELWTSLKKKEPKHCKDLQKKFPTYFSAHARNALSNYLGGSKVYKVKI